MSTLSAYSNITGKTERAINRQEKTEGVSPAEDAARYQAKINWLQSNTTQEMVSSLQKQFDALIDQSIIAASRFPEVDPMLCVKLLNKAQTIREVINTYARPNS